MTRIETTQGLKLKTYHYEEAKGLAYARGVINDELLLPDEDFVCQLDSHIIGLHKNWDETLIDWYHELKDDGTQPI